MVCLDQDDISTAFNSFIGNLAIPFIGSNTNFATEQPQYRVNKILWNSYTLHLEVLGNLDTTGTVTKMLKTKGHCKFTCEGVFFKTHEM
jgi:hypothetical protein